MTDNNEPQTERILDSDRALVLILNQAEAIVDLYSANKNIARQLVESEDQAVALMQDLEKLREERHATIREYMERKRELREVNNNLRGQMHRIAIQRDDLADALRAAQATIDELKGGVVEAIDELNEAAQQMSGEDMTGEQ